MSITCYVRQIIMTLLFSSQNIEISNFFKICVVVGVELFYADQQRDEKTDGNDGINIRFLQFC